MTKIFHLRKNDRVNVDLWLNEALDAARNADGVIVLTLEDSKDNEVIRIAYCNLNEMQLTWAAAKLQDFVQDLRKGIQDEI